MKIKKILWLTLGFFTLLLGSIGAIIPILPTVPFLLITLFSFGKSSEKLHRWFIGTKLYKKNLESYAKGQGMTWQSKLKIIITITLSIGLSCFIMLQKNLYIPCIILGCIWLILILYFTIGVKKYISHTEDISAQKDTNNNE